MFILRSFISVMKELPNLKCQHSTMRVSSVQKLAGNCVHCLFTLPDMVTVRGLLVA